MGIPLVAHLRTRSILLACLKSRDATQCFNSGQELQQRLRDSACRDRKSSDRKTLHPDPKSCQVLQWSRRLANRTKQAT